MKKITTLIVTIVVITMSDSLAQNNPALNQSNEKIVITNNCDSEKSDLKLEIIKNNYYLTCSNESILDSINPNKIKAIKIISDTLEKEEITKKLGIIKSRIKGNILLIELID